MRRHCAELEEATWEASEPSYGEGGITKCFGAEGTACAVAPVPSEGHATRKRLGCVKGVVRRRGKRCRV
jgi:hypothetical protein